jgi:hypothetical protein
MNKKLTLFLVILLAALVAAYFAFIHQWNGPDNEFHVADPTTIAKIEIVDMKGNEATRTLTLEKQDTSWQVNHRYPANPSKVTDLLKTLTEIRVKEPLSDKAQATALGLLKRNHTHVTLWDRDGKQIKEYLIGPTNSQQSANIFKMEFSDRCYLVSKPAMEGYVSIYYHTDETAWRDLMLWDLQGADIQEVAVSYRDGFYNRIMTKNFVLRHGKDGWLVDEEKPVQDRVDAYMSLFRGRVNAESFADTQYPAMRDSLKRRSPDAEIDVITRNDRRFNLKLYARPESAANFFAILNDGPELRTVQHYVIDPFLKAKDYFGVKPEIHFRVPEPTGND